MLKINKNIFPLSQIKAEVVLYNFRHQSSNVSLMKIHVNYSFQPAFFPPPRTPTESRGFITRLISASAARN